MHVTVGLRGENREIFKTLDRPPCATIIVAHQTFGHLRIVRPYPYCAQQSGAPEGVSIADNAAQTVQISFRAHLGDVPGPSRPQKECIMGLPAATQVQS